MSYMPPFSITNEMNDLSIRIGMKAQTLKDYELLNPNPMLRKQNRIRSIYSSCAIEANSLSFDQVSDLINGRRVVGPENDVKEIKNATEAYSLLGSFDPYNIEDFLRLHRVMIKDTAQESGIFRSGGEGVFSGDKLIFMAPPPELVPEHMKNLFDWLKESKGKIHPLIASCVFHYELVFIHPFTDGNGRMVRLWQTAILGDWLDIFYWLPVENRIRKSQDRYYETINRCNQIGESTPFIEFMLNAILISLDDAESDIKEALSKQPSSVDRLTRVMEQGKFYTSKELMALLNMTSRQSFQSNYLKPALDRGVVKMEYPDNPRRPGQRYKIP